VLIAVNRSYRIQPLNIYNHHSSGSCPFTDKTKKNFGKRFGYNSYYLDICLNIQLSNLMNIVFKALNDPTRREILEMLQQKDMTAGEIVDKFHISGPSISHHLDLLKQAKLVTAEKDGQFIYYSLNTTVVDEIMKWFLQFKSKKK
jgi:DNA-binding transcriptional ArsR family regulator